VLDPSQLDRPDVHVVVLDGYALGCGRGLTRSNRSEVPRGPRNGAPDHARRPRGERRRGRYHSFVLYAEKHALACLYLWESLELDNTDLTLRAKLSPEAGRGKRSLK
jgi:hypothetical protein